MPKILTETEAAMLRGKKPDTASSPDGKPIRERPLTMRALEHLAEASARFTKRAIDSEISKVRKEIAAANRKPARLSQEYLKGLVDTIGRNVFGRMAEREESVLRTIETEKASLLHVIANLRTEVGNLQAQLDQQRGVTISTHEELDGFGRVISTMKTTNRYAG